MDAIRILRGRIHFFLLTVGMVFLAAGEIRAQALPTGMTSLPIYDTTKAGLSFRKDRLPIVGMWEVPGKPKHFLVVGYFGYMWTLYPDTTQADTMAAWGPIKRYTRTQVADFNTWVMKGWEFGALGGSFDPNFSTNRYFYVIYNKYPDPSQYRAGTPGTNGNNDGPNNPNAIVVIDRYVVSMDFRSVVRDTEMIRIPHGSGYGSSNMLFGSDGMLYVTTDAYNTSSWDSTILARKILRIDVSRQDPGRMYAIPTDNPWYNVSNPAVKKEVYAFGFRNTYSLSFNYLTGQLYGAETGQSRWEEINHILPGRNYGWNNGADGASFGSNSQGIEGPCHIGNALDSSTGGGGYTATSNTSGSGAAFNTPYTRTITGTTYNGVYNCARFQNPSWYFNHGTGMVDGLSGSLAIAANVGNISPVVRGDPASPFYGYMFISDINHMNYLAVKNDRVAPVNVGRFPASYTRTGDVTHNGITTWAEDSYGNLYPILLSSRANGPEQWHDIFMLSHAQLTPLATPRTQVLPIPPTTSVWNSFRSAHKNLRLVANTMAGARLEIPRGYSRAEIFNIQGERVWSHKSHNGAAPDLRVPEGLGSGILQVRFLP